MFLNRTKDGTFIKGGFLCNPTEFSVLCITATTTNVALDLTASDHLVEFSTPLSSLSQEKKEEQISSSCKQIT